MAVLVELAEGRIVVGTHRIEQGQAGRIFDVDMGAAAQRPGFVLGAVAVVAEHGAGVAEAAPGDLGLAVAGLGPVELGLRAGVRDEDLLKRPGLLDRSLHAPATVAGGIDRGFVEEIGEVAIEGDVGLVEQRPDALGDRRGCDAGFDDRSFDDVLSLAQRREHGGEPLACFAAVAGAMQILGSLREAVSRGGLYHTLDMFRESTLTIWYPMATENGWLNSPGSRASRASITLGLRSDAGTPS